MTRKLSYVALILVLVSCAPQSIRRPGGTAQSEYLRQPVTQFAGIEDAYETYRAGIARIMEIVPDDPDVQPSPLRKLSEYKGIYKNLGWSRVARDNTIYAMTPGHVPGYWVSFVELDHPGLKARGSTLHVELNKNNFVAVIVRPDKISERWAGIFLVHELSHAKEDLEKRSSGGEASECNEYDLEKMMYNQITRNKFDGVLDEVLNAYSLSDVDELLGKGAVRISDYLHEIDHKMDEDVGLSIAETEMRHGFYLMAMVLRLSERVGDDTDTKVKKVNKAIAKYSMF